MPSRLHEDLLRLFQNRPALAAKLAREALQMRLPAYREARVDSANLSDLRPTEYRADLVILLSRDRPVHGIVVEVQLTRDDEKEYVWPAYVCNLRNRIRSPVCLLVITVDEDVARWASRWIELGGDSRFRPWVLSPSCIPEITDEEQAKSDPELAILSAMAHGESVDVERATRIALAAEAALLELDAERSNLYRDMLDQALSEAARRALQTMISGKYEYRSEFAKRYYGEGLTEGEAKGRLEGRAELITRQLTVRFGALPESVRGQLQSASTDELDRIGERLLAASTLSEALDPQSRV